MKNDILEGTGISIFLRSAGTKHMVNVFHELTRNRNCLMVCYIFLSVIISSKVRENIGYIDMVTLKSDLLIHV